jgi:tRNA threonylcarbamoyladenosine biosynthesis protein TsaE
MKFLCKNEDDLSGVADFLIKKIIETGDKSKSGAVVVGLHGDLGSGKTTFTKRFAKKIGIVEEITSPTFVVQRRFEIPEKDDDFLFKNLYHFDMYRIESLEELPPLGWEETISEKTNLVFVEWPEKISVAMPNNTIKMNFTFIDENTREIEVIAPNKLGGMMAVLKRLKNVFKK